MQNFNQFSLFKLLLPIRVAGITSRAGVHIPGNVIVLVSHVRRIIVFVAVDAAEGHKIPGGGMAFGAGVPFVFVFAAINGEIHVVVIKGGGVPGGFVVTKGAIRWEACRQVVGIVGAIVISLMAAHTGIGCVVEIAADMAIGAIGHIGMRAIEGPDSVVIEG